MQSRDVCLFGRSLYDTIADKEKPEGMKLTHFYLASFVSTYILKEKEIMSKKEIIKSNKEIQRDGFL